MRSSPAVLALAMSGAGGIGSDAAPGARPGAHGAARTRDGTPTPTAVYEVEAGSGARELRVEAAFARGPEGGLAFEDGMGRYVRDPEVASGTIAAWTPARLDDDAL